MNIKTALPILSDSVDNESIPTVDLRKIHIWLESKQEYTTWVKDRVIDYTQGVDYCTFDNFIKRENSNLGTTKTEYHVTLDVGKEICMMERNAKGREARKYFIACEKAAKEQIKIIRVIPPQLLRWQEHQSSVIPNHFILMEIVTFELTLKLANEGLDIFKKLMPESSLAYGFNKFLAAQGEVVTSFPNHPVYTNWGKQVPERCYPVRLRERAYNYFWEIWMPEKAPKYLKERQPEVLPVIHIAITDLDKRLNTLRLPAPQGRLF